MKRLWILIFPAFLMLIASLVLDVAGSEAKQPLEGTVNPPTFLRSWGGEGDRISNPEGIAITADKTLFISNTSLSRITRIEAVDPDQGRLWPYYNWGSFGTEPGQFFWAKGIAVDDQDNVYVVDQSPRIQKFNRSGDLITSWNKGVDDTMLARPRDLDIGPDGNVYVPETAAHRILVFSPQGELLRQWGEKGVGEGEFRLPWGIATEEVVEDEVTSVYVYVVDYRNQRIQKFDDKGTFILSWGEKGTGEGQFIKPYRIAVDGQSNVYVTDVGTQYVQMFDSNGAFLARWGGPGLKVAQFDLPRGIEVDMVTGDVYVADRTRIQRFPRSIVDNLANSERKEFSPEELREVKIWGADPTNFRYGGLGIFVDSNDRIYVTSRGPAGEEENLLTPEEVDESVMVFDRMGVLKEEWFDPPSRQFNHPDGIKGDRFGNIYVADAGNHRIVKFDGEGKELGAWGTDGNGQGEFNWPLDVTVNNSDQVFVADTFNHRVQTFDSEGSYLDEWGTPGIAAGQIISPTSVATDDQFVYVFDLGNLRVQKYEFDGSFVSQWGGPGDGDGEFGEIQSLTTIHEAPRIAVHEDMVFVTDPANHRVQIFDGQGNYLTQWGSEGSGAGEFTRELDVAVSNSGEIYIADMAGHRIQVFGFSGAETKILNGSFEDEPPLAEWRHSGQEGDPKDVSRTLPVSRYDETAAEGDFSLLLGEPVEVQEEGYENKSAWAYQTIHVDPDLRNPSLFFRYNMYVNDEINFADFLVEIEDDVGVNHLATAWRDGYRLKPGERWPPPASELGWRTGVFDLSAYQGKTIRLGFYNRYLNPGSSGMWTAIDDVRVISERTFLPLVSK